MPELPTRADLGQLRRRAKELLRAATAGEASSLGRMRQVSDRLDLASAQHAIATEHGFSGWRELKQSIERAASPVSALARDKFQEPAIYRPSDFLDFARRRGWRPGALPAGVVFTSAAHLTAFLERHPERFRLSDTLTPTNGRVFVTIDDPPVAVACLGAGATPVVPVVEHLAALGVPAFIGIGPAPSLSEVVSPEGCVVIDRALRDDGISQHYLEPARFALPDAGLTERLVDAASRAGLHPQRGPTWTVPTPYRTTAGELEAYRAEGVLVTELSAATLFAVATALGVRSAGAVIATHMLGAPPGRTRPARPRDPTVRLLDAAIAAIRSEQGNLP